MIEAHDLFEKGGDVGDKITNFAFVSLMMVARLMPAQITKIVSALGIIDDETLEKVGTVIESIISTLEDGDLAGLEDTIGDILEAGLFGVTAVQPNILLIIFVIMQIIVTGSATMIDKQMLTEEEATMLTRNICAKIWRTYGEVSKKIEEEFFYMTQYLNSLTGLSWPRMDWT